MAQYPSIPLFTDSYLADCGHLSDEEHGRYLLILIHLWRAPGQRFPNDDAWLARKFSRSVERVISELRPLIVEFCQTDGNWIWQKRLCDEWDYVQERSAKNSVSANKRWGKEKKACVGNAPTPTPYKKERGGKKSAMSDGFKALMAASLPTKQ